MNFTEKNTIRRVVDVVHRRAGVKVRACVFVGVRMVMIATCCLFVTDKGILDLGLLIVSSADGHHNRHEKNEMPLCVLAFGRRRDRREER